MTTGDGRSKTSVRARHPPRQQGVRWRRLSGASRGPARRLRASLPAVRARLRRADGLPAAVPRRRAVVVASRRARPSQDAQDRRPATPHQLITPAVCACGFSKFPSAVRPQFRKQAELQILPPSLRKTAGGGCGLLPATGSSVRFYVVFRGPTDLWYAPRKQWRSQKLCVGEARVTPLPAPSFFSSPLPFFRSRPLKSSWRV